MRKKEIIIKKNTKRKLSSNIYIYININNRFLLVPSIGNFGTKFPRETRISSGVIKPIRSMKKTIISLASIGCCFFRKPVCTFDIVCRNSRGKDRQKRRKETDIYTRRMVKVSSSFRSASFISLRSHYRCMFARGNLLPPLRINC